MFFGTGNVSSVEKSIGGQFFLRVRLNYYKKNNVNYKGEKSLCDGFVHVDHTTIFGNDTNMTKNSNIPKLLFWNEILDNHHHMLR